MRSLAKEILEERARTMSIAALAREIGISRSGLSRRLDGKLRWRPGEAEAVARLLGVPTYVIVATPSDSDSAAHQESEAVA